ncbi:uncharacterized protein LOC135143240 [Zophobas morio]|uniref:uncharacterized protein LOC135143240 n=1 Tax=Zophobas morio TaxID=2755281 RepID=UPI003083AB48
MTMSWLYESKIIILGDLNVTEFWNCTTGDVLLSNKVAILGNMSNFYELIQYNNNINCDNRILDLIYANFNLSVTSATDSVTPEDPYHPSLEITFGVSNDRTKKQKHGDHILEFNFKKANLIDLYTELAELNFDFLKNLNNIHDAVTMFYDAIHPILRKCVPTKKKPAGNYPVWYNRNIINLIKQKYKFWLQFKKTNCVIAHENFKALRRDIKKLVKDAYLIYMHNVSANVKNDPKRFWGFIKAKNNISSVPTTMSYKENALNSPQNIVETFADFFKTAFNISNSVQNSDYNSSNDPSIDYLNIENFDEEIVFKAMRKLKPTMTAGPDLIPSFLVKDCATILAKPVTILFNIILRTSTFPDVWKQSRITPIYKNGDRSNVTNYRPITIINNLAKVFEHVLHILIYPHVSNMITDSQHGFVKVLFGLDLNMHL